MKEQLIQEVQRQMLPHLNNAQLKQLQAVLEKALTGVTVHRDEAPDVSESVDTVSLFITAKRIEGCSEKTLNYYRQTIFAMLSGIGKLAQEITTEDLRMYLTDYQTQRKSSKVTIDNIRRILSSYFSWMEDEDHIVKSPVRRIHKVKTAKVIKETYSDETLEIMRDNCSSIRDLAMIDLLASSGMRVGEMSALNRDDINFNERECVVFGKGSKERIVYFDARTKIFKTIWRIVVTVIPLCLFLWHPHMSGYRSAVLRDDCGSWDEGWICLASTHINSEGRLQLPP